MAMHVFYTTVLYAAGVKHDRVDELHDLARELFSVTTGMLWWNIYEEHSNLNACIKKLCAPIRRDRGGESNSPQICE